MINETSTDSPRNSNSILLTTFPPGTKDEQSTPSATVGNESWHGEGSSALIFPPTMLASSPSASTVMSCVAACSDTSNISAAIWRASPDEQCSAITPFQLPLI